MNYQNINNRLREINTEDFIWIIYIGIIILSFYSNNLERDYFINNNIKSRDKYRNIILIIFLILTIVYTYFLKESIDDIRNLKETDSEKKKTLVYLSFLASLFIAVSGVIYLFIAFNNENLDVELAFN